MSRISPLAPDCGTNSCVDINRVQPNPDGFLFTSTETWNDGSVTYSRDEVETFFGEVKAGKWDYLLD